MFLFCFVIAGDGHGDEQYCFCFVLLLQVMDMALASGCPLLALNDSGGARIQQGLEGLAYYAAMAQVLNTIGRL